MLRYRRAAHIRAASRDRLGVSVSVWLWRCSRGSWTWWSLDSDRHRNAILQAPHCLGSPDAVEQGLKLRMQIGRIRVHGLMEPRSEQLNFHGLPRSLAGDQLQPARAPRIWFTAQSFVGALAVPATSFLLARSTDQLMAPASSPAQPGSTHVCGTARELI